MYIVHRNKHATCADALTKVNFCGIYNMLAPTPCDTLVFQSNHAKLS